MMKLRKKNFNIFFSARYLVKHIVWCNCDSKYVICEPWLYFRKSTDSAYKEKMYLLSSCNFGIQTGRYKSRTGSIRIADLNKNSSYSRTRHTTVVVIVIHESWCTTSHIVMSCFLPAACLANSISIWKVAIRIRFEKEVKRNWEMLITLCGDSDWKYSFRAKIVQGLKLNVKHFLLTHMFLRLQTINPSSTGEVLKKHTKV